MPARMLSRRGSRSSEHVPEAPQQPAIAEAERKFRILVVDDSAANRKLTMWMLGRLGYFADAAGNGCEALEAIERGSFDLILMDCRMPEMDGYEATRQIRRRGGMSRNLKIVGMSAYAQPGDGTKRDKAGLDDNIGKPFKIGELAAVLERVLGGRTKTAREATSAWDPRTEESPREGAEEPALDVVIMASLRAQDGLLDGLIETVLKEVPERLQQILASFARADTENGAIAAHSLKSIAAIFGARRMQSSAANIERAADARSTENARSELAQLRMECERVLHELEKERAKRVA